MYRPFAYLSLLVMLACILPAYNPAGAQAPITYSVVDFVPPQIDPYGYSSPPWSSRMNTAGQFAWPSIVNNISRASIYTNGQLTLLPLFPPPNDTGIFVIDINNNANATGFYQPVASDGLNYDHAFIGSSFGITDLGTLDNAPGSSSDATSINDGGQVVGYSLLSNGAMHAFLYSNGHMSDLNAVWDSTEYSYASGINNKSEIIGYIKGNSVLYSNNTLTKLGAFEADYINNNSQIAGEVGTYPYQHAAIYTQGQITNIGVLPGLDTSHVTGFNDQGQIVGYCSPWNSTGGDWAPFLWDKKQGMKNFNDLLDASGAGITIDYVYGLNNKGFVLAKGHYMDGVYTVFIYCMLKPSNVAQVTADRIQFQSNGQSIWTQGQGRFDFDYFLGPQWDTGIKTISVPHGGYFDPCTPEIGFDTPLGHVTVVPAICLGEFGAVLTAGTKGQAGLHFSAHADGGTANVNCPMTVKLQFPDRNSIFVNQKFIISSNYLLDNAGTLSATSPSASASLHAIAQFDNTLHFAAKAFGTSLIESDLLPADLLHVNVDKPIFDFNIGLPGGEPKDFYLPSEDQPLIEGYAKFPQLLPSGGVAGQMLAASAEDTVLSLNGHITDWLSEIFGIPLSGEKSWNDRDIYIGYNALDLRAKADFRLHEDLTFTPNPHIHFDVSEPVTWNVLPSGPTSTSHSIDFNAGQSIQVTMPSSLNLTFTPTVSLPNTFTNTVSVVIDPDLSFVPLEIYGAASVYGWNLGSFDWVPWNWDIASTRLNIPLPTISFNLNNFTLKVLSPVTVIGKLHPAPSLQSADPPGATMIIVKDHLPDLPDTTPGSSYADFLGRVQANTKVTLSGTNFATDGTQVQLSYYGNTLTLQPTVLDDSVLQVQVPNKLFLLPGVARFTVTTPSGGKGSSNSLDFPINYPKPSLANAGPGLWASDPHFNDALVFVIGQDFITRWDYFRPFNPQADPKFAQPRLQTYWNKAFAGSPAMPTFFPNFDWQSLAPLPTVYWNGLPTSLYLEPYPSGGLPSLLPHNFFATSQIAYVTVVNPSPVDSGSPNPGSVTSEQRAILIGAPQPVLKTAMPSHVQPGDPDTRITIKGLSHIPDDPHNLTSVMAQGFEANSTVIFDGNALFTIFISATELQAIVPTMAMTTGGIHQIAVINPWTDFTGATGTHLSPQSLSFSVVAPVPTLGALYPATVATANPGFQGNSNALMYNLSVRAGNNPKTNFPDNSFVPNCYVMWNKTKLQTRYQSQQALDAIVPAQLVAQTGKVNITVVNPATMVNPIDGGTSNALTFTIANAVPGKGTANLKLTALKPNVVYAGSKDILVGIQGSGFCAASIVNVNGVAHTTTTSFLNFNGVVVKLSANDLRNAGKLALTVTNPAPGGGTSNLLTLSVKGAALSQLTLVPARVQGGLSVTGKLSLNSPAPTGGLTVTLTNSNSAATVPQSVSVASGATTTTFPITTKSVTTDTMGTITATAGGVSKSASITVKTAALLSITLNASTVKGGKTLGGLLKLTGIAAVDTRIALRSSNPAATVPANITVLAGKSSASVTVTTSKVNANTSGNITATLGSVSKSAPLMVTP